MAKRPLPKNNTKDVLMVNQLTVKSSVQFPQLQAAVATATGGSNGGNGKNGKNGKDDTLTKDEFNSGFQDGVGQIKDGFSSLGAGLGPLQVIVDFVKGFVSKIGNLFTIFKGFFNILMSIPKAIANAFKKKDKEDDKKDSKKGKLKKALEKDRKKEKDKDRKSSKKGRAGFARFATMLKPALIVGAVLAISAGLIMLYNWLVGKGLFKLIDDLATNFRLGLIDLQLGIAKIFGKEQKLEMLKEEKAALIIEKKVLPNLSQGDKEALSTMDTPAAQASYLANLATTKGYGIDIESARKAMSRTSGSMREAVDNTVIGKEEDGSDVKLNIGGVDAVDTTEYSLDTKIKIKDLDLETLTADMNLGTTLRTSSQFTETKQQGFGVLRDDLVYGVRTIDKEDGTPLTVDDLTDQILEKDKGETFKTRAEAYALAQEIVAESPGISFGKDGVIIRTDGFVDNSVIEGGVLLTKDDSGALVEDRTTQAAVSAYLGLELGEDGTLQKVEKLPFFDALGAGQIFRYFDAFSDESRERDEKIADEDAKDLINEKKLDRAIVKDQDSVLKLKLEEILAKDGEITEKDREFINDLEEYQSKGGVASEFGIYFDQAPDRKDRSFYEKDFYDKERMAGAFDWALKSDEDIRAMLVEDLMEMSELDEATATQVVNNYVDSSSTFQQNVTPQSDNGPATGTGNQTVDVTQ